ncbi:MAG: hypothetical protein KGQ66_22695 [Acidobacteriota bacterium]|nr:hypothetical protein [Acidobacteriota bacterium]
MLIEIGSDTVTKVGQTAAERGRLTAEAAVLDSLVHPGVVSVVAADRRPDGVERLTLRRVPGGTLGELPAAPLETVAAWGAAIATIVADIHDLGFAHGSLGPEHVVIDGDGRPVLCGFADARRLGHCADPDREATEDTAAIAHLVLDRAPALRGRGRRTIARYADGPHWPRRMGLGSARNLARDLVRVVPDARLTAAVDEGGLEGGAGTAGTAEADGLDRSAEFGQPRARPGGPRPSGRAEDRQAGTGDGWVHRVLPIRRPRWRFDHRSGALGALAGSALAGSVVLLFGVSHAPRVPATPADSYVLSVASNQAMVSVTGRWACGLPRPAVLDTSNESLWLFDRWPAPGQRLAARLVERVPDATGLGVVSGPGPCDRLVVLGPSGGYLGVKVSPAR